MTDDERFNPTFKSRLVEWGKVAGAISAIVVCVGLVWGIMVGPIGDLWNRFDDVVESNERIQLAQADMQKGQQAILESITTLLATQARNVARIEALEAAKVQDGSPAIRFTPRGHTIEDGQPGSVVQITWQYFKLRDCGRPDIDLIFRNGGGRLHRFSSVSVLDQEGRGIASEPDPTMVQTISYTARIPGNEGVHPGRAAGWVRVTYPDCPGVAPVTSPEVIFSILPG